jgi:hypothetical protein
MKSVFAFIVFVLSIILSSGTAYAISWRVSCGTDPGAITHEGSTYIFQTSSNHCTGGFYKQRAELKADDIPNTRKATYVFDTVVAMTSGSNEEFTIFQIQDGVAAGCAPPMNIRWTSGGKLGLRGDFTKGQDNCVENTSIRNAQYRGPTLKRDGTSYRLQVQVALDGQGGFDVNVFVDGKVSISGSYRPANNSSYIYSDVFFFKHGVYSKNVFNYRMTSTGLRVSKQ